MLSDDQRLQLAHDLGLPRPVLNRDFPIWQRAYNSVRQFFYGLGIDLRLR